MTVNLPQDPELLSDLIALQAEIASHDLDLDGVRQLIVDRAAELTRADAAVVELVEGDELVYRAVTGAAEGHLGERLAIGSSLSGRCVLERRVLRTDDAAADPRVDEAVARRVGAGSMLCLPLLHRGEAVGVLKVYAARTHAFSERDAQALGALSTVIAAKLSHATRFEQKAHESLHDALTGVGNRRGYDARLAKELARARRYAQPLSLLLVDLDDFKQINDRLGHAAGDEALRAVGAALHGSRLADDAFRVGGDEFALIMPGTSLDGARLVGDRMVASIGRLQAAGRPLSASAGAAEASGEEPLALHEAADAALREAKRRRDVGR